MRSQQNYLVGENISTYILYFQVISKIKILQPVHNQLKSN